MKQYMIQSQILLAVGNYMNAGNHRVGGAIGFKISFLTQVQVGSVVMSMFRDKHITGVYHRPEAERVGVQLRENHIKYCSLP